VHVFLAPIFALNRRLSVRRRWHFAVASKSAQHLRRTLHRQKYNAEIHVRSPYVAARLAVELSIRVLFSDVPESSTNNMYVVILQFLKHDKRNFKWCDYVNCVSESIDI
jgi:hypothetical protein